LPQGEPTDAGNEEWPFAARHPTSTTAETPPRRHDPCEVLSALRLIVGGQGQWRPIPRAPPLPATVYRSKCGAVWRSVSSRRSAAICSARRRPGSPFRAPKGDRSAGRARSARCVRDPRGLGQSECWGRRPTIRTNWPSANVRRCRREPLHFSERTIIRTWQSSPDRCSRLVKCVNGSWPGTEGRALVNPEQAPPLVAAATVGSAPRARLSLAAIDPGVRRYSSVVRAAHPRKPL
jgi:hypothetical protein